MRAKDSASMPPPQPTSSACMPANGSAGSHGKEVEVPKEIPCGGAWRVLSMEDMTASRMNWQRAGFRRCSGAKGPLGSHQREDREENLRASLGSRDDDGDAAVAYDRATTFVINCLHIDVSTFAELLFVVSHTPTHYAVVRPVWDFERVHRS